MVKECEHKETRKMFYQDSTKWVKTQYAFCKDCGKALEIKKEMRVIE